jgi:catabolite regulation protein CreA
MLPAVGENASNASLSCETVNAPITIEQHFKTIGNISEIF